MTFNWKTLKTLITLHQILMMTHGDAGAQVDEDNSTELLAFLTKQQGSTHPGHLANVLSTAKTKHEKGAKFMNKLNTGPSPPPKDDEIVVNGKRYSRSSTSHLPTNLKKLVHLLIEVPMVVLLEMTFVSLKSLIELLMSETLTIIKSPTSLL